jgi:hypothetical protein
MARLTDINRIASKIASLSTMLSQDPRYLAQFNDVIDLLTRIGPYDESSSTASGTAQSPPPPPPPTTEPKQGQSSNATPRHPVPASDRSEHDPAAIIDVNTIVALFSNRAFEIGESLVERGVLEKEDFNDTNLTSNQLFALSVLECALISVTLNRQPASSSEASSDTTLVKRSEMDNNSHHHEDAEDDDCESSYHDITNVDDIDLRGLDVEPHEEGGGGREEEAHLIMMEESTSQEYSSTLSTPETKQRTFSEFQRDSKRLFMLPNGVLLTRTEWPDPGMVLVNVLGELSQLLEGKEWRSDLDSAGFSEDEVMFELERMVLLCKVYFFLSSYRYISFYISYWYISFFLSFFPVYFFLSFLPVYFFLSLPRMVPFPSIFPRANSVAIHMEIG